MNCIGNAYKQQTKKIWFAQMLRGLAALSVVFAHIFVAPFPYMGTLLHDSTVSLITSQNIFASFYYSVANNGLNFGAVGVGIFFIISGFVISFSVAKRTRFAFLANRLLRIYPVVVAVLLFDFCILSLYLNVKGINSNLSIADFVFNATLFMRPILGGLHVDGVLWTLEIEIFFYIVMLLIGKKLISLKCHITYILCMLVVFVLLEQSNLDYPFLIFLKNSVPHLLLMHFGVLSYNVYTERWTRFQCVLATIFTLGGAAYSYYAVYGEHYELTLSYLVWPVLIWSFIFKFQDYFRPNRTLNFLANISFSLYLVHQILGFMVVAILMSKGINVYIAIAIAFCVALIVAWVVNRLVEQKAQVLSRTF